MPAIMLFCHAALHSLPMSPFVLQTQACCHPHSAPPLSWTIPIRLARRQLISMRPIRTQPGTPSLRRHLRLPVETDAGVRLRIYLCRVFRAAVERVSRTILWGLAGRFRCSMRSWVPRWQLMTTFAAAKHLAEREHNSVGEVFSALARQGLRVGPQSGAPAIWRGSGHTGSRQLATLAKLHDGRLATLDHRMAAGAISGGRKIQELIS